MARIVPPTYKAIAEAAEILGGGGLVAFPTETVYGLGAHALDEESVARIFEAKGRPSTNPVIIHVGSIADAERIGEFRLIHPEGRYDVVEHLTRKLWPGPLTVVVRRKSSIPDIVTAGGDTVGIRMPDNPVALALLSACRFPLAAPSANRSEGISPTTAQHVADSLGDVVDLIIDGGRCRVGLESTVLDCTELPLQILRPGMISRDQIADAAGTPVVEGHCSGGPARSPGQMTRHYSPHTPLALEAVEEFWWTAAGGPIDVPLLAYTNPTIDVSNREWIRLPDTPGGYAKGLYAALHRLDEAATRLDAPYILVEAPPDGDEWDAIRDRLMRAAAKG